MNNSHEIIEQNKFITEKCQIKFLKTEILAAIPHKCSTSTKRFSSHYLKIPLPLRVFSSICNSWLGCRKLTVKLGD